MGNKSAKSSVQIINDRNNAAANSSNSSRVKPINHVNFRDTRNDNTNTNNNNNNNKSSSQFVRLKMISPSNRKLFNSNNNNYNDLIVEDINGETTTTTTTMITTKRPGKMSLKTGKSPPLSDDNQKLAATVADTTSSTTFKKEKKRAALYPENTKTFYVGAGNNSELIIDIMKKLGWEQIFESTDDSYKLKWVQCGRSINWNTFREGEQMVNHIPNCSLFTNKLNLLCSLQAFEKLQAQAQNQNKLPVFMPLEEYVPLTYKLDDRVDKETFFQTAKNDELWICKPVSLNQGKGIYLVRSPEALKQKLELTEDGQQRRFGISKPLGRIIQKYIHNPLLINKRKFDIRCYMLIASTKPLLALFHHGYLRLSMNEFHNDDNNLITHLTNQYFQKKDPQYKDIKEDTTWTMEQFNDYVNENLLSSKQIPKDWVNNELTKKMHQIMLQVVHSVRYKIQRKIGYFGIYGYDFMIDEDMKVWLIEINVNPAITTNTDTLVKAIPPAIEEGIHISIECFEKAKANKKLLPLSTQKNYMLLYNETSSPIMRMSYDRSPTLMRRQTNISPNSPVNQQQILLQRAQQRSPTLNITTSLNSQFVTASQPVMPKTAEFSHRPNRSNGEPSNSIHERNVYSSSIYGKKAQSNSGSSTTTDGKQPELSKIKFSSIGARYRTQTSLTSLELKPATVEVYFRTSSGKSQRIERKTLPPTIFPPPKIGLKS